MYRKIDRRDHNATCDGGFAQQQCVIILVDMAQVRTKGGKIVTFERAPEVGKNRHCRTTLATCQ